MIKEVDVDGNRTRVVEWFCRSRFSHANALQMQTQKFCGGAMRLAREPWRGPVAQAPYQSTTHGSFRLQTFSFIRGVGAFLLSCVGRALARESRLVSFAHSAIRSFISFISFISTKHAPPLFTITYRQAATRPLLCRTRLHLQLPSRNQDMDRLSWAFCLPILRSFAMSPTNIRSSLLRQMRYLRQDTTVWTV